MLALQLGNWFFKDLAIDLGTANTLIALRGKGIVLCEPSYISVHTKTRHPVAIGRAAKRMLGRTPDTIEVVRPLHGGVIADFETTMTMLHSFITAVHHRQYLVRPRMIVGVPSGITQVERRAVRETGELIGARAVYLVDETLAAALGVGVSMAEPDGSMILDIGGGTTEATVISLGGVVYSRSVRMAGDAMDEAIVQHVKHKHNMLIGTYTGEMVKLALGSALLERAPRSMPVRGQDMLSGLPKIVVLTSAEVYEALQESLRVIVETIMATLERTPPELSADIIDRGIIMTGGGALLPDLDRRLRAATGLPVTVADAPLFSVVRGVHRLLADLHLLERVAL